MRKWGVLNSEYIYQSPFGNLRKDTCQMPDGTIIQDYYVNEYSDWVNAIVITKDDDIILVEQYRHPGKDYYLEIPAGKIEEGETYAEGIVREVREETGYISAQQPILLGEFMVNPATQTNKVITFLIKDAYHACDQELDETEVIDVKRYPFESVEKMIREREITQLFSVNAYYLAKNYLDMNNDVPKLV